MPDNVLPSFIHRVEKLMGSPVSDAVLIQSLWSGYGQCFRIYLADQSMPFVVKAVSPPDVPYHPRGWNTSSGHRRKCRSFQVELAFYRDYQPALPDESPAPSLVRAENAPDKHNDVLLIMQDLDSAGFEARHSALSVNDCSTVLHWLAHFHAHHIGQTATDLWEQGNYWHLSTRQDEWHAMPDSPLKARAYDIDKRLRGCEFQTIIHGDAKVANFCFNRELTRCAAVDFQYTGKGTGVEDVAYFLGSALSDSDLNTATDVCLNTYFTALKKALSTTPFAQYANDIVSQWRELYPFACADFRRFLLGWSPAHYKLNTALEKWSDKALHRLFTGTENQ